ncbi:AMP-binding protein [uncultured Marinobacter sp.]|uniref:class I adenylate-forming enzyme family protein n=1 Tax=uncultured Marinobacter sp. TaxID=187379 RepID=UPI0030DAAC0E
MMPSSTPSSLLTLKALYTGALARFGDRCALTMHGAELTYRDLLQQAIRAGNGLIDAGVRPDTPVAIAMANCLEFAVADQGIIQAGATKVPLNDMLSDDEVLYILENAGAQVAIVDARRVPLLASKRDQLPQLHTVIVVGEALERPEGMTPWQAFLSSARPEYTEVDVQPHHLAFIGYTGGTTGKPKGVLHSQQNFYLNLLSHLTEMCLQDDERLLLTSPLPHAAGLLLATGLLKGANHFIEPGFDPATVIRRISQDRVTVTFMVPTMIYRLLDWLEAHDGPAPDLSALRSMIYGAAPITVDRLQQGLATFGQVFMQLYGQSEAPNFITRLRREDHNPDFPERLLSCGQPATMSRVRIVNDQGEEVPVGESGEVTALTPYNMLGYHQLPEKTASTLVNGWVHTGDIGRVDADGYLYLLDRKNDMIISGGMNVYTSEIENVLQPCEGVGQVAVVGLPDPDWGEAVTAFVVPEPGNAPDTAALILHCKASLSKYKVPKAIHLVDSLPVTAYGKLDKKVLRQQWSERS